MKLDPKLLAYVIGAVGVLAGAAGGYVRVTTPEAAECAVSLADKSARLELTGEAMDSCRKALELCGGAR